MAVVLGEVPGTEPWRGEVLRRAELFQAALRVGAIEAITTAAAALAGLGEGSTPAGDDYLVGVLHALARGRPPSPRMAPLVASLGGIGETRTTAASAAWLAAAARGEASPVWRALLDVLASGSEVDVRRAARAVRGTGHTSGAFSLRGFLDTLSG
ncbi:MAG TPA: DUF2877 domain-containing protein [Thermoanaerobaculia bacterium]|nr:DUF2877 domain-containing protein [Thermoanaerobaculia bacterium]